MEKIIITGSEGLLGKSICKHFEKTHKILKLDLTLGHDLQDEEFVKSWFKSNKANYLINCFALNDHVDNKRKKQNIFNFPLTHFDKYLKVNVTSLFSVCREFAKNNKSGAIVNFSSIYGLVSPKPELYDGSHKDIAYGVSKAAVINMTKYLAVHLAPNFRVNCIAPGGVLFKQDKKFVENYSKNTPMERMMNSNELHGVLDLLCNKSSKYMTGSTLVIDGGYTVW